MMMLWAWVMRQPVYRPTELWQAYREDYRRMYGKELPQAYIDRIEGEL